MIAPIVNMAHVVPPTSRKEHDDSHSEHSTSTAPVEVHFEDNDSITSSSDESINVPNDKPVIPDGEWGWMVVFSCLILSLIQDGVSFAFGVLYVEFLEEFQASKSVTSWIGSLLLSVPLIFGPVMSALVDNYGCRNMTILGGLVSTVGFVLSTYSTNIGLMFLTFGLISGLGLGLTYITAVVSLAFWFEKKRNLAVGLGACGTGIGTFLYAPLTTYLLFEYQWRGTVLLLGGTLLNMCVCGALMRDPDWIIEQDKQNAKLTKSSRSSKCSSLSVVSSQQEKINLDEIRTLLKSGKDAEYILQTIASSVQAEEKEEGMPHEHHSSVINLPTFVNRKHESVPVEVLEQLSENKNIYKIIVQNYPSLLLCKSVSDKGLNKITEDALGSRVPVTFTIKPKNADKPKNFLPHQCSLPENASEPLMKDEQKNKKESHMPRVSSGPWLLKQFIPPNPHSSYFKNMRFPRHSLIHRGTILNKNKYKFRASSCPNIYRVSMATLAKLDEDESWWSSMLDTIKELFDFSLFLEMHFFLFSLSTVILFGWFMTPYFYLTDHLLLNDYTATEASLVMSVIGVTNTIGMVALGWAGDQSWCNVTKAYGICLLLCGVTCSAMIFFTSNYVMLNISAGLFGIFIASTFSFTPVMLVELYPLDMFTKAYGLNLLCEGLGHLGGPPIAGYLFDFTGTWVTSFHLSALWIVISGILILVIPYTKDRKMCGTGPLERDRENA